MELPVCWQREALKRLHNDFLSSAQDPLCKTKWSNTVIFFLFFFFWMPALFWCIVLVYFRNCHYSRVSNSGRKTWSCFYFCLSRAGKTWIHGFIFERTASLKCECRCSGWLVIAVWTFQTSSCYLRVGVASWGGRFLLTEWGTWQMWKWQTNKHPVNAWFHFF